MHHKSWLIADDFAFPMDLWVNFRKPVYEEGVYGGYLKNDTNVQQQIPAAKIRNPVYMSMLFKVSFRFSHVLIASDNLWVLCQSFLSASFPVAELWDCDFAQNWYVGHDVPA